MELPAADAERVSRTLAARDLFVTELRPDEVDLETVFLELTRDPEDVAMIRLLGSEWLRFRSRRIVRWLMLISVIGIVVVALHRSVGLAQADGGPARASSERRYEPGRRRSASSRTGSARCPRAPASRRTAVAATPATNSPVPSASGSTSSSELVLGAAFIVVLIGLVLGASMVGASWQTGTITTILTWEPRRVRWFLARVVVIAVGAALVAAVLLAILAAALACVAALRGTTATSTPWIADTALTVLRIGAAAGGIAVIGGAVAMIGRHTAAALGAVFVYLAVLESIVRGLRPAMGRFMLGDNLTTVLTAHTLTVHQDTATYLLTPQRGAVVIGAYVLVLVGVSLALLRVRDVN